MILIIACCDKEAFIQDVPGMTQLFLHRNFSELCEIKEKRDCKAKSETNQYISSDCSLSARH